MTAPGSLAGKTVLVTGASSGIGRATAVEAARAGARVVAVGRDGERLSETRELLSGEDHVAEQFELADAERLPEWLRAVASRTGPLHGVVHCAGIQQTAPIRVLSAASAAKLLQVNVLSGMMLLRAFRQKGCSWRGGSFVFVGSVMGHAGRPGLLAYSASKGAVSAMTRSAAAELAPEGLRVNCVAPGYVKTAMTEELLADAQSAIAALHPLGLGEPADVANACVFLLSDAARWITGATLAVDGGYTAV